MPGIALRTTLLTGFPGETEGDVDELVQFIEAVRFDRVGVFTYSHEEGTSGFELTDDVPEEVKQQRASRIMEAQEIVSFDINQQKSAGSLKF